MAVNTFSNQLNASINQVVQQILALRHEMHQEMSSLETRLTDRMNREISSLKDSMTVLEKDMSAVKERLSMRTQIRSELRNRFFDYGFKTTWIMLAAAMPCIIAFVVMLVKSFS